MAKTIAWKNLHHAHGPAARVPAQIEALAAAAPDDYNRAYWPLQDALVGRGKWYEASAPAVSLLLRSVAKAGAPAWLIVLAADILGADQLRGWLRPIDAPLSRAAKAAHEAAVEESGALFDALASPDGRVRGAAAMALAMLPELSTRSVGPLVRQATSDGDEVARAGAALALGRIGEREAEAALEALRKPGTPALARGAAGWSRLRRDPGRAFASARAEVEAGLSYVGGELPWFKDLMWFHNVPFPDAMGRALAALARERGPEGVEALSAMALASGVEYALGPVQVQAAKILLDLAGFSGKPADRTRLFEELSPEKAALARELAGTRLLPAGGFGLPASGAVRRRWAGLEPGGPLDRRIDHRGKSLPLWRAWNTRPPAPADCPSALDRWQALVEYSAWSHPPFGKAMQPAEIEQELSKLEPSAALFARAAATADDLAGRFAAIAHALGPRPVPFVTSALLLLPWVRAGRAIEPRWDRLVYIGKEPQSAELLGALPDDRREAAVLAHLETYSGGSLLLVAIGAADFITPPMLAALGPRFEALAGDKRVQNDKKKLRELLAKRGISLGDALEAGKDAEAADSSAAKASRRAPGRAVKAAKPAGAKKKAAKTK